MTNDTAGALGPVQSSERITVIDCLRGAALFGILTANMRAFHAPFGAYFRPDLAWTWPPDRIAQALVDWLVSGKFITIFAVLFGVGFAIQMERAATRGRGMSFYARRMAALLVIGLAHAFGVWWGDILALYAVCGAALMLFRNTSQRWLLRWGVLWYCFIPVLFLGFFVATWFGVKPPDLPAPTLEQFQETTRIYSQGTYSQIAAQRAKEWMQANSFIVGLTQILSLFLFGTYLWRQGYLRDPIMYRHWWRRAQRIGLPIGLIGNAIVVAAGLSGEVNPMEFRPINMVLMVVQFVAVPSMSLFYASTVILLYHDPVWQRRLQPFSYVGRMALTNYLLQSVICTTIFYSYGLGLYGRSGPLLDLPLTIAIYALQVPFSRWWLDSHRYGPMEWVWRRMTYGRAVDATAGHPPAATLA